MGQRRRRRSRRPWLHPEYATGDARKLVSRRVWLTVSAGDMWARAYRGGGGGRGGAGREDSWADVHGPMKDDLRCSTTERAFFKAAGHKFNCRFRAKAAYKALEQGAISYFIDSEGRCCAHVRCFTRSDVESSFLALACAVRAPASVERYCDTYGTNAMLEWKGGDMHRSGVLIVRHTVMRDEGRPSEDESLGSKHVRGGEGRRGAWRLTTAVKGGVRHR